MSKMQPLSELGKRQMDFYDKIDAMNAQSDERYELEQQGPEAVENAAVEAEWEREDAEFEQQQEDEANLFTGQEEFEDFYNSTEDGGIGDLTGDSASEQHLIDEHTLLVADGRNPADRRVWEESADTVRKVNKMGGLQTKNERTHTHLHAMKHRQMLKDNRDSTPLPEPVTPAQYQEKFAFENPDFDGETLGDAISRVDQKLDGQFIEHGYVRNNDFPSVYGPSGDEARDAAYIRNRNRE